jgi:Amt family ammonium transporter
MLGAALLWVGWFGFNAGSAVASNGTAGLALLNTIAATTAAISIFFIIFPELYFVNYF